MGVAADMATASACVVKHRGNLGVGNYEVK